MPALPAIAPPPALSAMAADVSTAASAAAVGAAICLLISPYLARLTLSAPDREATGWWRGRPASRSRALATAATAAVLGTLAGATTGLGAAFAAYLALALVGAPLAVIDLEHHRLPDRLMVVLAAVEAVLLTVTAAATGDWHSWLRALEGAAAVYAVLFALAFVSPGSFGFGDVNLGGVLGGYLGFAGWGYVYYGILGGFVLGAFVAVVLLATRRAGMKTAIPFGPMLILGALLVLAFDLVPSSI